MSAGRESVTPVVAGETEYRSDGADPIPPGGKSLVFRAAATGAKACVSIGLILFLFARYSPGLDRFAHLHIGWYVAAVAVSAAGLLPSAERWRIVLERLGSDARRGRVFQVLYASLFFTQVLPSIGGDVVRVLYYRLLNAGIGSLLISVVVDRGLALAGICVLTMLSVPYLAGIPGGASVAWSAGAVAGTALVLSYAAAIGLPRLTRTQLWGRLPLPIRSLGESIAWALVSRVGISRLLPLSLLVHLLSISSMYFIGRALAVDLSFWDFLALGPIILLAHVTPVSIGGWGVREAAAVFLLTLAGADTGSALAISVLFGAAVVVLTLPGALFWMALRE